MKTGKRNLALAVIAAGGTVVSTLSMSANGAEKHEASDAVHAYAHYGRHHLSSFAGWTHVEGGDYSTGSLEYEYRLSPFIGIGVIAEYVGGAFNADSYMAALDVHPFETGMIFQFGLGKEFRTVRHASGLYPHSDIDHGIAESEISEREEKVNLARAGLLYEFEFGRFTLAPQVHWDYHHHEPNSVVYGVSAGVNF